MKLTLKYLLLFLIFSLLFVLPPILLPFPPSLQSQGNGNPLVLLLPLCVDLIALVYLIQRLPFRGMHLYLMVLIVFWSLQTGMTQIETWYFRDAMPAVTNPVLIRLFLHPFLTAIVFIPIGISMLGKWKPAENIQLFALSFKTQWRTMTSLSVAYVFIYFLFGHYVAWQFVEVRNFYSGSVELLGFGDQFLNTLQIHPLILPFQLLRGFLWILAGLPLLSLKGSRAEKILAFIFMYSILPSVLLLIDNPIMPASVRMAHLLEVSSSNGLFGLLIGWMMSRQA